MTTDQYDHMPRQRQERAAPRYVVRQDPAATCSPSAIAYVCTSVASILFVALVVYGYVKVQQLGTALSQLGGLPAGVSAPGYTPAPTAPLPPR